mmetsp:Transcript_84348/g.212683  ORF Transcript_84348/g.212683 Transcript_84348/m.212683 type:complete len:247 (+) Transcript_84348:148-888(+)
MAVVRVPHGAARTEDRTDRGFVHLVARQRVLAAHRRDDLAHLRVHSGDDVVPGLHSEVVDYHWVHDAAVAEDEQGRALEARGHEGDCLDAHLRGHEFREASAQRVACDVEPLRSALVDTPCDVTHELRKGLRSGSRVEEGGPEGDRLGDADGHPRAYGFEPLHQHGRHPNRDVVEYVQRRVRATDRDDTASARCVGELEESGPVVLRGAPEREVVAPGIALVNVRHPPIGEEVFQCTLDRVRGLVG